MTSNLTNIEQFKELLLKACGHQFIDERERTLVGAIRQRMDRREMREAEHYYTLLRDDREELQQLVDLLTVNETYFFREPEYLHLVMDHLIPELLRKRPDQAVRIVCAGCATGEEPYSLAMLLDQRFGAASSQRFHIAAGDIDATAIARARQGVYGPGSFRGDQGVAFRDRYFSPLGADTWQLGEVRRQVHFEVLNLLADSYPTAFQRPDIILYRNVSIYFPSRIQGEIFRRLADQLCEGGCLLVGASETMHHNLGILQLLERNSLFFFSKGRPLPALAKRQAPTKQAQPPNRRWPGTLSASPSAAGQAASRPPKAGRTGKPPAAPVTNPAPQSIAPAALFAEALILARSQRLDQALGLLEQIIAADCSCSRAYALKGTILAEMDRFAEVQQLGQIALQHDPLCLEACLLLGVTARHQGDNTEAGRRFREALYVNRACWPAHFYLAEIAYTKGEPGLAKRGYQNALEVLEKGDGSAKEDIFFPLSFNPSHLISVCRHKLSLLDG